MMCEHGTANRFSCDDNVKPRFFYGIEYTLCDHHYIVMLGKFQNEKDFRYQILAESKKRKIVG